MFRIATLDEVLDGSRASCSTSTSSAPPRWSQPYEATLAQVLRKFDRRDDVIVASFLDPSTEAFHRAAPEIPTSAGTMTVAAFWRAVQQGQPPPTLEHCALQVPERRGDLVIVDERFVEAAHSQGVAVHVWTVNQREAMERLVRPRGRRHHHGPADHPPDGPRQDRQRLGPARDRRRGPGLVARLRSGTNPVPRWAASRGWPSSCACSFASQSSSTQEGHGSASE